MTIIVNCPACGIKNRVNEDINRSSICGKCKSPLLLHQSPTLTQLTINSFDMFIQNAKKPVLVDFGAEWCAPCKQLLPILGKFAESHYAISVARVDTESNPLLASRFKIFSIPTLILFVNAIETKRVTGALSLEALEYELSPWLRLN